MNTPYQHREIGTVMLCMIASAGLAAAVLLAAIAPNFSVILPAILLTAAITGVVATFFSSMTIQVHESWLSWHFGPGLWRHTIPLADIGAIAESW